MSEQGGGQSNGFNRTRRDRPAFSAESGKRLLDREQPHSAEAEMSLLGSMILDPQMITDVISIVRTPEDFYHDKHAHIYRALVDVFDKHHSGDLVQILDALRDRGVIDLVGGSEYLVELANAVPTSVNAKHYARIVAEKAKLRKLITAAGQILFDAYHSGELGPEGAREVLDTAERAVFEIAQEDQTNEPQKLAELLEAEMTRIEKEDFEGGALSGVKTSYGELDELLRGLQPGELIIVAARPSMGKTALCLNMAEQIAIGGVPVPGAPATQNVPIGIFSLEMSKNAIVQRMLSARSGVSSQLLRGGHKIPDGDFSRIMEAASDLKHAPIFIDDTPNMTVLQLRARSRRLVAQHGVKVIMIDYLQLMTAPGAARESRQVEVSAISRGVKALARELNIPVICLSQLNRASEQREGNRPRMSDLRESGSIEQDADVIVLLHREDYYHVQDEAWMNDPDNHDKIGTAELIVAKQRNGPTGVVKLKWDARTTRFRNFEAHSMPPGGMGGFVEPRGGYSSPSAAASSFPGGDAPFVAANPFEKRGFAPGKKSGPVDGHRDGGGPDRNEETGLGDDLPV